MRRSFFFVFLFHLAVLAWVGFHSVKKEKKVPLIVKTIIQKAPRQIASISPAPAAKTVASKSTPSRTTPSKNPPQKKQPATKSTAAPIAQKKKKNKCVPSHLLKELEESIAKIDEKRDKESGEKKWQWTHSFKIDSVEENDADYGKIDASYTESLIRNLQNALDLPEYGPVKIELTLREDGGGR